ncbi:MAG: dTDP-glucose pyrophosphorylase [Sediminicola sp.]|jgi:dTDP-glucose pyrophosphorylase
MIKFKENIISNLNSAREALKRLDTLPDTVSRTLFVINDEDQLLGTITDGDIRRGLLNGLEISTNISQYMNTSFKFLAKNDKNQNQIIKKFKDNDIALLPVVEDGKLLKIIDLNDIKTILPVAALIMAGGKGERLRPLTANTPKPMLKVGDKPIIEHNIDRLVSYGINTIYISVKYLKDQIIDYLGDGSSKGINIIYIEEEKALGTIGCLSMIPNLVHEEILILNSDIITNIDYEDFYNFFKESDTRLSVASIPYTVNVPYAVLDTEKSTIKSFKEKPSYTYYSNGGIYFLKSSAKDLIPHNEFYNATDLMTLLIDQGERIVHYPILGYWLDIGRHQDYLKAQEDIVHIKL